MTVTNVRLHDGYPTPPPYTHTLPTLLHVSHLHIFYISRGCLVITCDTVAQSHSPTLYATLSLSPMTCDNQVTLQYFDVGSS